MRRPGHPCAAAPAGAVRLLGPGLIYLTVLFLVPLALLLSYTVFDRGRFGGVVYEFTPATTSPGPSTRSTFRRARHLAGDRGLATLIALLIGYPMAYAIAQLPRAGGRSRWSLVVLPFWTNFLIRTYAWIVLLNSAGRAQRRPASVSGSSTSR